MKVLVTPPHIETPYKVGAWIGPGAIIDKSLIPPMY